jgi:cell division septation protein DedD
MAPAGDTPADNRTTAAGQTYKIQLGSFLSKDGAQALVEKLRARGYQPHIETHTVSGKKTAYRVRVGSFMSMAEAQQTATDIEKKEGIDVMITSQ